ncbi:ATP-binding cassette, subfamily B [Desulfonispora thiosulfatigenes DSM 11270]|uniref:ATP-binding cassette, subfamily B n=1 Tax=Desulfonispora thiosulfatigenes DSM 11270 TaxID=656914 RepID=A0A1W1UEV7_DESTI|nr:ABC transporter ATP-binding protein [Desulfonispora thiosulfatigenes]SMB79572.1 ATP-binding cassette, subfamily B [Desulfonispora thiosulfatigenes DSM 11270]
MLKLAKHLKPFMGLIILAIMLLFVQAMADLSLPDYMARIVNNGIQQGGIVNAVPEAVRQSKMDKLTIFMNEQDKKEVLEQYKLIDRSSSDYNQYVKTYPTLAKEPIYVSNKIDKTKFEQLNSVMGKSFLAVTGIEKMQTEAKDGFIYIMGNKVPANTDLYELFANLPENKRTEISNQMNEQFIALGDKMVIQAAASSIKSEYNALGIDTNQMQNKYILKMGIYMLMIALVSAVAIVLVGFLSSKTAAGLAKNLRQLVFSKVENFSKTELDKFSTATLITRTTNDITQIQTLVVMMIRMVIYAPILGVGGVFKALKHSPSMSWIIAVAVIALLILIVGIFSVAMPKFKLIQKLIDKLNLVTRENLSGMMVIRAFNTQNFEEKRFDEANKDLIKTNLFVNRVMVLMHPIMMLIMNGIVLLIVWVGANQIANSSMQVGDMMAFMQYAMQIIMAFLMMSFMFIMIPRAAVSAVRIVEVLETEPEIKDPEQPKEFKENLKNTVEFKDVSFRYQGAEEDMIKKVSFTALPGQTTAFIGSTGSGKTTLVNLIPRFYDVTSGQILVDGVDIREVSQHDLREKIGYVPQKSSLFSGTIESNLKYAKEAATDNELLKAAEIAQATEFIKEKPEGIKTEISQGGANVSGGQKQRLSIARALVKKPGIYIFDDSFSALDFKTDAALRRALREITSYSTILLVAQRVSSIIAADQIIVLNDGEIVCKGTHKELMENCPTYQEIALSQLSKEELA